MNDRITISQTTAVLRWLFLLPVTFSVSATAEVVSSFLRVIPGTAGHVAFGFVGAFSHTFLAVLAARVIAPQYKRATGAIVWCAAIVELIGRNDYLFEARAQAQSPSGLSAVGVVYMTVFIAGPTLAAYLPTYPEVRVRWATWKPVVRNVLAFPLATLATATIHNFVIAGAPLFGLRDTAIADLEVRFLTASVFIVVMTAIVSVRKLWVCWLVSLPFIGWGVWMIATGLGDDPAHPTVYARVTGSVEILATIVPLIATGRYCRRVAQTHERGSTWIALV